MIRRARPSVPSRSHAVVVALCALGLAPAGLVRAQEPIDRAAVSFFREQGLEHSEVMDHLSWMCDVYGPRLTGSPNLRRAQQWAVQAFTSFGLANAHTEAWGPFGRGWRCDRASVEVVGDNAWPVLAYAKAWSPSLPGRVEAEVVHVGDLTAEQLEASDLRGKIVLMEPMRTVDEPWEGLGKRYTDEELAKMTGDQPAPPPRAATPVPEAVAAAARAGEGDAAARAAEAARQNDFRMGFAKRLAVLRAVLKQQPLALVDRATKGDYGTVFVQGAQASPREGDAPGRGDVRSKDAVVVPQFTFAVEHYNRICRVLQKGLPVRIALELQVSYFDDDANDYNVLAELPGADPVLKDQVVMLGAHFDSWHSGTGTTDNGCGSAVVMEAARLLAAWCKASGKAPRRTIRAALWSGEEQGLLGSRGYTQQHFGERGMPTAEHGKVSGYFNLDNGTGKIRGVYLQQNDAVARIFGAWLEPFADLGATTINPGNTGGTDHQSFDGLGIPGFQFVQDPVSYGTRTHHSNMDVWDHAVAADLRQASVVMAAFVWHTAQRDELLPRKPLPEPRQPGEDTGRQRGGR